MYALKFVGCRFLVHFRIMESMAGRSSPTKMTLYKTDMVMHTVDAKQSSWPIMSLHCETILDLLQTYSSK